MTGGKRSGVTITKAQRVKKFVSLRTQGLSYRAIADTWEKQTGSKISKTTVQSDIAGELRSLAEQTRNEAEHYRDIELMRLDMAMSAIAQKVSQGHVGAGSLWVKISESRRKLLGLDAPVQLQIQQGLDSELEGFLDFLENRVSTEAYSELMAAIALFQGQIAAAATN